MSEKNRIIRLETKDDYRAVENLTRESFWNVYRPGCMEHYVLLALWSEGRRIFSISGNGNSICHAVLSDGG